MELLHLVRLLKKNKALVYNLANMGGRCKFDYYSKNLLKILSNTIELSHIISYHNKFHIQTL